MARKSRRSRRTGAAPLPAAEAQRFAPANRRRLSGPGLRAFLAITERWGLGAAERRAILGRPARSTYYGWRAKARRRARLTLPGAVLLRISAVLAIHRALCRLFDAAEAAAWLREPHGAPDFGGRPPLALVTGGTPEGPLIVLHYLNALCQGICPAPAPAGLDLPPYGDDDIVIL